MARDWRTTARMMATAAAAAAVSRAAESMRRLMDEAGRPELDGPVSAPQPPRFVEPASPFQALPVHAAPVHAAPAHQVPVPPHVPTEERTIAAQVHPPHEFGPTPVVVPSRGIGFRPEPRTVSPVAEMPVISRPWGREPEEPPHLVLPPDPAPAPAPAPTYATAASIVDDLEDEDDDDEEFDDETVSVDPASPVGPDDDVAEDVREGERPTDDVAATGVDEPEDAREPGATAEEREQEEAARAERKKAKAKAKKKRKAKERRAQELTDHDTAVLEVQPPEAVAQVDTAEVIPTDAHVMEQLPAEDVELPAAVAHETVAGPVPATAEPAPDKPAPDTSMLAEHVATEDVPAEASAEDPAATETPDDEPAVVEARVAVVSPPTPSPTPPTPSPTTPTTVPSVPASTDDTSTGRHRRDSSAVTGTVRSTRGRGLGGIRVAVFDINENVVASAVSGTGGTFVLDDVPPGVYRLKASDDGYDFTSAWRGGSSFELASPLKVKDRKTRRKTDVTLVSAPRIAVDVDVRSKKAVVGISVTERGTGIPASGAVRVSTKHFRAELPLVDGRSELTLLGPSKGAQSIGKTIDVEYRGNEHTARGSRSASLR